MVPWNEPAPTYAEAQKTRIHMARLVEYGNHWFIAKKNLDLFEDYYGAEVGDIIVVQAKTGVSIYFELAAEVEGWGHEPEESFLIIRVDPEREFDKLPVLDVHPEEAAILRAKKET
jgi:hypothetical protein